MELGQQSRGKADRAEEISSDDGFSVGDAAGVVEEIFRPHDACVEDDGVEGGVVGGELSGNLADVGGVFDVELDGVHTGISGSGLVENLFAATGDDDLVAKFVEGLCEARPIPEPPPVMRIMLPVMFIGSFLLDG